MLINELAAPSERLRSVCKEDLDKVYERLLVLNNLTVPELLRAIEIIPQTLPYPMMHQNVSEVDWERGSRRKLAGVSCGKRSYASDFGVIFCFQERRKCC